MPETTSGATATRTVALSKNTTVVMREISALETLTCDDYVGASPSDTRAYKTYAVCSLVEINGKPVTPLANELEFKATIQKLTPTELGKLVKAYVDWSNEVAKAEEAPKGSPETAPSNALSS